MSFEANWPGVCADCETWFTRGEQITRKAQGIYTHAACPTPVETVPTTTVCPRCFTHLSKTGKCGCDDE